MASSDVEGLDVEVFVPGADILAPNEIREISITASAPTAPVGYHPIEIVVDSNEVDSTSGSLTCGVVEAVPTLVASPSILERDMLVGEVTYVDVTIRNVGYAETGALDVLITEIDWLELVSPATIDPLDPGAEAVVTLRLSPDEDLLQGPYSATPGIVVNDQTDASVGVGVNTIFNANHVQNCI